MYQELRQARTAAINKCLDIPNISSLPCRRLVTFQYREFKVPIKISCVQEQVSLAFACAVKGMAVEARQLQAIFAEDCMLNHVCVCHSVPMCHADCHAGCSLYIGVNANA